MPSPDTTWYDVDLPEAPEGYTFLVQRHFSDHGPTVRIMLRGTMVCSRYVSRAQERENRLGCDEETVAWVLAQHVDWLFRQPKERWKPGMEVNGRH